MRPKSLALFMICAGFAMPAAAQNAALVVTVRDSSQAVIPQAAITLVNLETGVTLNSRTGESGNYEFPALQPGNYSMKVECAGFKTFVQSPINLVVDQRARVDVALEVGAATETVTVSEGVAGVQAESSTVGEVIDTKKVLDMPLNGRFFLDLAMLAPGTVVPSTNNRTFLAVPTSGGALGLNSSGAREDSVNYLFDGINLSDMVQNQITLLPNVEIIREFKVQSNSFSAEYGRNAGIIINAVTKSGSNEFHGSAFEFLRNDRLDARNFFDLPRPVAKAQTGREIPPFKRNIYGESLGGPVIRNRLFFFESFEGRRQRESDTFRATVPTAEQRAAVTNPVIKRLLTLVPQPNTGGAVNNFAGSASKNRDLDQVTGKIDHMLSERNTLSGTYIFQRDERVEPTSIGSHNLPGYGDFRPARRQLVALRYLRVFTPRLTHELRFGVNRVHITFTENFKANPADFGISGGAADNFPDIRVAGGPSFAGLTGFPQGRGDTLLQYTDAAAWVHGRHSLKFGGEIRRFLNNNFNQGTGGLIQFPSMTAFLAGQPNRTQIVRGEVTPAIRVTAYDAYFQDDYKAAPRLTFNLGVRYEYNGVPAEKHNRLTVFDFSRRQLVPLGTGGIDRVYRKDFNNVGPRAGFSWDPFGRAATVVRGGYGIYFDQPVTNVVTGLGSNPPWAIPIVVTTPNIDVANPFAFTGALTPAPAAVAPDFVGAYVQQYNLNIQHERWNTVFQAAYVGSAGRHLRLTRDVNQGIRNVRPIAGFGQMNIQESSSRSNYNAAWFSANRRLAHGLTFTTSYAFSKSIDLNSVSSSNPQIQNAYDVNAEKGLSDFDARHRWVASVIYELPFRASGGLSRFAEGWSLAGIANIQSGNPYSPIVAALRSGSQNNFDRPDVVAGAPLYPARRSPNLWVNPAAFTLNALNSFGNAGRNILTAPPFKNLDLALLKNARIKERASVQLRAEFFDALNHANFGQPGNVVGTPTFGVISATRSPRGDLGSSRQIEFGLKLLF
jgi:hypothetical protein